MIRKGKFSDINQIIEVCKEAALKSVSNHVPIHDDVLKKSLQIIIHSPEHCCFVTEIDGKIEGVMLGVSNPLWYSKKKTANDLFVYTTEKGKGSGAYLMRRFISWAKKQPGVEEIMLGTNSGIDQDRTKALYERMGAKKIGDSFYIER